MAKYYSYNVSKGDWSYRCRAGGAQHAKRIAANWYKKHKAPHLSVAGLMWTMSAKRVR
jgi:hypothetical protein